MRVEKRGRLARAVFVICLSVVPALPARGQATSPNRTDVQEGAKIFRSHCASCHGANGSGGLGANLAAGVFFRGSSDAAISANISGGIAGTAMPAGLFNDKQVRQLVAYVRSLSAMTSANPPHGDAEAGKEVFARNGCSTCHIVKGEGGTNGPDLSNIGSQRSADYLRESIVDPNAQVAPQFWVAKITTKDGKSYAGFIMDEDTYTIQILDLTRGLQSLSKSDFQDFRVDKNSIMPSFKGRLSDKDLEDLAQISHQKSAMQLD